MESNQSFSLFVIDDDILVHKILSHLFKKYDEIGVVDYFNNGLKALEHLEGLSGENYPDAILLDLNMPIMDGFDFLEKAKKMKHFDKKTQIVILSTSTRSPDIRLSMSNELVRDYFAKPLKKDDIEKLINYMQVRT